MTTPKGPKSPMNAKPTTGAAAASAVTLDPSQCKAGFDACRAELDALPERDILAPKLDVQLAASCALRSFGLLSYLRPRFERLAAVGEFDLTPLDGLPPMARAAWYARHKALIAAGSRTAATLPAALVEKGYALKERMLRCVDYNLGDDPEVARNIATIRTGTGHLDLANDLVALGEIYESAAGVLKADSKLYRPGDAKEAMSCADSIIDLMRAPTSDEHDKWLGYQARAWTLLSRAYDEVRRTVQFLEPDKAEELCPSLYNATRSGRRAAAQESGEDDAFAPEAGAGAGAVAGAGATNGHSVPPPAG